LYAVWTHVTDTKGMACAVTWEANVALALQKLSRGKNKHSDA